MTKYVVTEYKNYPIYEPAEGGYYYNGREINGVLGKFDTREQAIEALGKHINQLNDGIDQNTEWYAVQSIDGDRAFTTNHNYYGEGYYWEVEPINRKGRAAQGQQVYC